MSKFYHTILISIFLSLNLVSNGNVLDKNVLRWSSDTQSGAPHAFFDPSNPKNLIGFEYDILSEIAKELNVSLKFYQNDWDTLIPGLKRGLYDLVIDGINSEDISGKKDDIVLASIPYYITHMRLAVVNNNSKIRSLKDLDGKTIGIFKENFLTDKLVNEMTNVNIKFYSDEINAYTDLKTGRLDATLFDYPNALYYTSSDKRIKLIDEKIGSLKYVIIVNAENIPLYNKINQAIENLKMSGKLREILENWNLWNPEMAEYLNDHKKPNSQPIAYDKYVKEMNKQFNFVSICKQYSKFLPILLQAALKTMEISILAMILAIALGIVIAIAHQYGPFPLRLLSVSYIEIVRGTPLLIQILFVFYGLPLLGQVLPDSMQFMSGIFNFSPFFAGVIALGVNYSAYEAENYRAGLSYVSESQMEAARALGMNHFQGLKNVVIPQAFRVVIPPVTNDFISLIKDSSLVSIITIVELTKTYQQLATTYCDYFGTGIIVAILYLLLGLPFVRLSRWVERRLALERKKKRYK